MGGQGECGLHYAGGWKLRSRRMGFEEWEVRSFVEITHGGELRAIGGRWLVNGRWGHSRISGDSGWELGYDLRHGEVY